MIENCILVLKVTVCIEIPQGYKLQYSVPPSNPIPELFVCIFMTYDNLYQVVSK